MAVMEQRRIEISEFNLNMPSYRESYESKDSLIAKYLTNWLKDAYLAGKIKETDLMPTKDRMACFFNVSVGTIQSAIRYVEDKGYLVSKQRIGTMVTNIDNPTQEVRKLTSKRDKIINEIKKIIIDKKIKVNQALPSSRKLSDMLNVSANTTRLAYEYLRNEGIVESRFTRGNDANWILKQIPIIDLDNQQDSSEIKADTLVSKITEELRNYISENLDVAEKLPSHSVLSEILGVSIKTIHDAIQILIDEGILLARRGRYGTIVQRKPNASALEPKKETSIFASAEEAAFYSYQKVENQILTMIVKEYELGDKLPSMESLAQSLDVSTNTIRKALKNISARGIVQFNRGRYGGTFITDIPDNFEQKAFKWLSVNPKYVEAYAN